MASYVGLATGAGASEGLETLLARMREEDRMEQQRRQLAENERRNQAQEEYQRMQQDIMRPYYEGLGKQATAGAAENEAQARYAQFRTDMLGDLMGAPRPTSFEEQLNAPMAPTPVQLRVPSPEGTGQATAASPGAAATSSTLADTPETRLRLQVAGVSPNTVFGAPETAANITPEEAFLDQFAREHGKQNYRQLSTPEFEKAKRRWAAAGRDPLTIDRYQLAVDRFTHTKEMDDWRKTQAAERDNLAKQKFEMTLQPPMSGMALAEYSDRIKREVKESDPPAKYDTIRDEVLSKYQNLKQQQTGKTGTNVAPVSGRPKIISATRVQ